MKTYFIVIIVLVVWASGQVFAQATMDQDEIAALRTELRVMRQEIAALRTQLPQKELSIGVMPIENAGKIPEVGEAFRAVIISALRESGVFSTESLDRRTVEWVLEQDRLVRERLIDPRSAPKIGELAGVSHFLFGTVTRYEEWDASDECAILLGIFSVKVGGGVKVWRGSLVVDFRVVDAESGRVVDAFRTEASVRRKEYAGVVFKGGGGYGHHKQESLPEAGARACAQQAAERIALQFLPQTATTAVTSSTSSCTTRPAK